MNNKKRGMKGWLGLALSLLIFPSIALADSTWSPVSGDVVMQFLGSIFGKLGAFSGSGDVFGEAIRNFNSAILVIGGVVVTYTLILGVIGTAHDGEVLGKKLHSAGTPIKTLMGTALVLPVSGGYSLIQIFVSTLVVLGIGIADTTWSSYAGTAQGLENNLSINISPMSGQTFGYEVFKKMVCVKINQQKVVNSSPTLNPLAKNANFSAYAKTNGTVTTYYFGDQNNPSKQGCGTLSIDTGDQKISWPKNIGQFGNLDNKDTTASVTLKLNGVKFADQLIQKMGTLADKIVNGNTVAGSEIDAVIDNYDKQRRDDANQAIASQNFMNDVAKQATEGGFISVATYYVSFMQISDALNKAVNNIPTVDDSLYTSNDKKGLSEIEVLAYTRAGDSLRDTRLGNAGGIGFRQSDAKDNESASIQNTDFNSTYNNNGKDLTKALASYVRANLLGGIDTKTNALAMSKRMGDQILNFSGQLALGTGIMMTAVGLLSGGASTFLGNMLQIFLITAIPIGFLLSFVVPMVPLFVGLGVIISYVCLVVESIILAPILALATLNPHGDEYLGSSKTGITIIFGLTLRPVLIVLGFIASSSLLIIISQYIGYVFAPIFNGLNSSSSYFVQFLSAIGAYGIYGGLIFAIAKSLFSIMGTLPDAVLQFLNGGKDSAHTNASHQVSDTAAMAGNYTAGRAVGQVMGGGVSMAGNLSASGGKAIRGGLDTLGQNMQNFNAKEERLGKEFKSKMDGFDSLNDDASDDKGGLSEKFGDTDLGGGGDAGWSALKEKYAGKSASAPEVSSTNQWKASDIASPKMVSRAKMIAKEQGMDSINNDTFSSYKTTAEFLNKNADHVSADGLSVNMIRSGFKTREDYDNTMKSNEENDN